MGIIYILYRYYIIYIIGIIYVSHSVCSLMKHAFVSIRDGSNINYTNGSKCFEMVCPGLLNAVAYLQQWLSRFLVHFLRSGDLHWKGRPRYSNMAGKLMEKMAGKLIVFVAAKIRTFMDIPISMGKSWTSMVFFSHYHCWLPDGQKAKSSSDKTLLRIKWDSKKMNQLGKNLLNPRLTCATE